MQGLSFTKCHRCDIDERFVPALPPYNSLTVNVELSKVNDE